MSHKHHPLTKEHISKTLATNTSGVYRIYFGSLRSKSYIGSSKNIRTRLHDHRRKLEKGQHKNRILNSLYKQYGNECLFEIVKECNEKEARSYEQLIIDFNSKNLYNLDKQVFNYQYKRRR
tara:strand:+ start:1856 stop:2218 length:363 start_codon:yes stop_codon:yes gene_type:complete